MPNSSAMGGRRRRRVYWACGAGVLIATLFLGGCLIYQSVKSSGSAAAALRRIQTTREYVPIRPDFDDATGSHEGGSAQERLLFGPPIRIPVQRLVVGSDLKWIPNSAWSAGGYRTLGQARLPGSCQLTVQTVSYEQLPVQATTALDSIQIAQIRNGSSDLLSLSVSCS